MNLIITLIKTSLYIIILLDCSIICSMYDIYFVKVFIVHLL